MGLQLRYTLAHGLPKRTLHAGPTPSEADIKVTRNLIHAGQLLKIDVLDRVIIGRATPERAEDYYSLRELGNFYQVWRVTPKPRFSELNKVKVTPPSREEWEGYVVESRFKDGRWIYKLSMMEESNKGESFDCWFPEEWLQTSK